METLGLFSLERLGGRLIDVHEINAGPGQSVRLFPLLEGVGINDRRYNLKGKKIKSILCSTWLESEKHSLLIRFHCSHPHGTN